MIDMNMSELESLNKELLGELRWKEKQYLAMRDQIDKLQAVAEAAKECNRLLNEWELIRQHSYAHEKLSEALARLEKE